MLKKGINILSKTSLGYGLLSRGFIVKESFSPTWIDRPTTLQLDTQNRCNLNCVYCNVKKGGAYDLERGVMSLELIEKTLGYFNKKLYCVAPFLNGEPLLDSRLNKINDLIMNIGAKSVIDTNGTNYRNRELLLHRNLFMTRFTISAVNRETYLKVHGANLFSDALKTLYWFSDHKSPGQNIMLHFIANNLNENQIEEYARFFRGFKMRIFPVHSTAEQRASFRSKGVLEFPENRPLVIDERGHRKIEVLKPNYPCQCWDILTVSYRGELMQCPDVPYLANYGNIKTVDPMEAWKQRNLNRMNNRYCQTCNVKNPKYREIFDTYIKPV